MNTEIPDNVRDYAFRALDCFDRMAKPEIKNRVMGSIWSYIFKYIQKTISKKPERELHEKLLEIYLVLNPLFENLQLSAEIHKAESLGSIPVPEVGEMSKAKKLLEINEEKAARLIEDLLDR
jgi:hypothetical protein